MTKKLGIYDFGKAGKESSAGALKFIISQMQASGLRERTVRDHKTHISSFIKATDIKHIDDVNSAHIYEGLGKMDVSNSTKLIRLKCLKAF